MRLFKKRMGVMEIDYLMFSVFRYSIWVTRSVHYHKRPRVIIHKFSKDPNIGAIKTWCWNFG